MTQTSIPPMRIIIFTTQSPRLANLIIPFLESQGHEVPLLVTTPGPKARRNNVYKEIVAQADPKQSILVTNTVAQLPVLLSGLAPDLILTMGFSWRFPSALLSLPRLGCINFHPSLLPYYRGPNPLFWPFMNGESQVGLTVHRMDAEFDTGPILAQRAIDIAPDDDIDSIFPRFMEIGLPMFQEALEAVASGAPGRPQPAGEGSYAPLTTEADRQIDWNRAATQLRNQVRAWGREGAKAMVNGQSILIRRARVLEGTENAAPGTVLEHSAKWLKMQTGDGILLLEDFVPAEDKSH